MTLHHLPLVDVCFTCLSSSLVRWAAFPLSSPLLSSPLPPPPCLSCLVCLVGILLLDAGCEELASTSNFSVDHFQPQKKSLIRQMAPDCAKDRLSFVLTLHHTMRSCSDWYDSLETNTPLTPKNCVHTPLSHSHSLLG